MQAGRDSKNYGHDVYIAKNPHKDYVPQNKTINNATKIVTGVKNIPKE
jgi:hypothetical protein